MRYGAVAVLVFIAMFAVILPACKTVLDANGTRTVSVDQAALGLVLGAQQQALTSIVAAQATENAAERENKLIAARDKLDMAQDIIREITGAKAEGEQGNGR